MKRIKMLIREVLTIFRDEGKREAFRFLCKERLKADSYCIQKIRKRREIFFFCGSCCTAAKEQSLQKCNKQGKDGGKKSFYKKYYEVAALEKKDFSLKKFVQLHEFFQRKAKKTKNKKMGFKRSF